MTSTRVMRREPGTRREAATRETTRSSTVSREGSLSEARTAGEPHGIFSRPKQRFGLVDAFLLLGGRIGIVDDAGARLDRHAAVLHHRRPEHDAGVHLAVGAEIADAARIRPALVLLQLVDDLHRPYLGGSRDRAG